MGTEPLGLLGLILGTLSTLVVGWSLYALQRKDKAHDDDRDNVRTRLSNIEAKAQKAEVDAKDFISRAESDGKLEKVFDKLEDIRKDFMIELKEIQQSMVSMMGQRHGDGK